MERIKELETEVSQLKKDISVLKKNNKEIYESETSLQQHMNRKQRENESLCREVRGLKQWQFTGRALLAVYSCLSYVY